MPRLSASAARRPAPKDALDAPQTSSQILDVAERLAQTRGFNGSSYADIAAELGITKASLHYHFPSKAELGRAIIDRYSTTFQAALDHLEHSGATATAQLERYVAIYGDVLRGGRICLCGMLAAEYTTLPAGMQEAIRGFFDTNERWLSRLLESGRAAHTIDFDGTTQDAARNITAALEGAMLLARPYGDGARFAAAADRLLRQFSPAQRTPARAVTRRKATRSKPAPRKPSK
jgi:TetR/AcrR family transcriptional regulator, transcriptional repressor for nem operon